MKPALLVLAAGIGSRYGGLKQIDAVGPRGEIVLDYSIYDALRAGFGKVVFVIRREIESEFRSAIGGKYESRVDVLYVYQELARIPSPYQVPADRLKPWGTAHATWAAAASIGEPFAVVNADDFYGRRAYERVAAHLAGQDVESTEYAMVGFALRDTLSEHGHVARGVCEVEADANLVRIVERTHIVQESGGAYFIDSNGVRGPLTGDETVSMNFWGLTPSIFPLLDEQLEGFLRERGEDPKAEFYLPTVIDTLLHSERARVKVLTSPDRWYGITYREDKPRLVSGIRELVRQGLYPERLW